MRERIVDINNVTFSYGDNVVLENVNINIEKGDFVGIIGSNGSAKSTLLKLMVGLLKPDKGNIKLFEKDIKEFRDYKKIGYISQDVREFNTNFPATVEEIVGANLYSSLGFFKKTNELEREKINKALSIVDMKEYGHRLIGNLSGGQKQRVFIARALVNNPEIIFMDEPLVGVDLESQNVFYRLMENLNKNYNITLAMVSHDIGVISKKVNKIFCLGKGKVYIHDVDDKFSMKNLKHIYGEDMDILFHEH